MTPEQKIRAKLSLTCAKILPKGRFLLQPVETNTVGVPDFYLSYSLDQGKTNRSLWLETKTTEYVVDRFQYTWALRHATTGAQTFILSHLPNRPRQTAIRSPTTGHHATSPHAPTPPAQPQPPSSPSGLYLLSFDSKMLDYSTLGRYITQESPQLRAFEDYILSGWRL
jgi:hypothetical protein